MKGDQWFTLWMTLIQTVGGGLVTLAGVLLGFRFSRRATKQEQVEMLEREELAHWADVLARGRKKLLTDSGTIIGCAKAGRGDEGWEPYREWWSKEWFARKPPKG